MDSYKEMITEQVRFMEGRVLFNEEQINLPASECKWDFEDDDAYYLFNAGLDFKIYNLGAFVTKPWNIGMSGIAVSKQQLVVNFARNDVQDDCEVYCRMKKVIRENRIKTTRRTRRTLTTSLRFATLRDLRDNTQDIKGIQSLSLIPTAQGRHISLSDIRKVKQQWCFAPQGDRRADKMMERGDALCICQDLLVDLGYTGIPEMFFVWLTHTEQWRYGNNIWEDIAKLYVDFEDLTSNMSDSYVVLPDKKQTVTERRIITVLQKMACWNQRRILLGSSDTAAAWTDGSTYICIDRTWLKSKHLTCGTHINQLLMTMAHEMAHDIDTRGTHYHGPEFDRNMIQILESDSSPTCWAANFCHNMSKSRIEERRVKEAQQQEKAKHKVNKKLGIAAKEK